MAEVSRYLLRTEKQIFAVRRHLAFLAVPAARTALYIVAAFLAMWVFDRIPLFRLASLFFLLLSIGWFFWEVLDWAIESFVVTNRRVLLISGVLTRRVAIMPLIKVTDLTYEQTVLGRFLDYGTFVFESAGQQQGLDRIEYLPHPNKHYNEVSALLFGTQMDVDPEDTVLRLNTQPVPHVEPEA